MICRSVRYIVKIRDLTLKWRQRPQSHINRHRDTYRHNSRALDPSPVRIRPHSFDGMRGKGAVPQARISRSAISTNVWWGSILIGLLVSPILPAHAIDFTWEVLATNNTGMIVDDFHALFRGTGGTISNEVVTMNDPNAGPATIVVVDAGNAIQIDWGAPGLPAGGMFEFEFYTAHSPVEFDSGIWTIGGVPIAAVNPADIGLRRVPEPATLLLIGAGLLVLAAHGRPVRAGLYYWLN
jgi:PEP-CTERM motif